MEDAVDFSFIWRKSYSYFKCETQHNVTDEGVHTAKCVFTPWTVCTYFLHVALDCPCMLFWQLEARTWHDERDSWYWHEKNPPSHECWGFRHIISIQNVLGGQKLQWPVSSPTSVIKCTDPQTAAGFCGFNGPSRSPQSSAVWFTEELQVLLVDGAGATLPVVVLLLLDFRSKRASISSSSLKELFPYLSFHQARYWKEKAQGGQQVFEPYTLYTV